MSKLKTNKFRGGFSLAELMVVLVLVSLLAAALIPVVTKKHLGLPKKSEHGSYLCYYKNGKLYEKRTSNHAVGGATVIDNPVENCVFNPPAKALYFHISAVGGGGGGGDSGYTGGSAHSGWNDLKLLPVFGLDGNGITLENLKKLHVIYKDKGYFPATAGSTHTVVEDLSGHIYAYAKSEDSAVGADLGYIACSESAQTKTEYKTTTTYGNTIDTYVCGTCKASTSTSGTTVTTSKGCLATSSFDTTQLVWESPNKPYTNTTVSNVETCTDIPTGTSTSVVTTTGCAKYTVTSTPNNICTCPGGTSGAAGSSGLGADQCMGMGCTPSVVYSVTSTCVSYNTETTLVANTTKSCDTTKVTTVTSGFTDAWSSYTTTLGSNTCCVSCDGVWDPAGHWSSSGYGITDINVSSYTCTIDNTRGISWGGGRYFGSGGDKGIGVACHQVTGSPYNLSKGDTFTFDSYARNGSYIALTGSYPTDPSNAEDGKTMCLDGVQRNDCGSQTPYASFTINQVGTGQSWTAKAVDAPKSGEGAKRLSIGIEAGTSASFDGSTLLSAWNSPATCAGGAFGAACPRGTYQDDAAKGASGTNGSCGVTTNTEIGNTGGWCNIPASVKVAYCLEHHAPYSPGWDSSGNALPNIDKWEPGYGTKEPAYRYRDSYDENYLTYGNAGYAGETKTLVVRSLKNMDTTIKIGRGGAAGAHGSGADGLPGSETKMGNVISAAGGRGGEGGLIGKSERLPAYNEDEYNTEKATYNACLSPADPSTTSSCASGLKYFVSTGAMQGKLSILKSLATNLFNYLKPNKNDDYSDLFEQQGKGGSGGGVTHRCWAGQFIVWFEGKILTATSIFPANGKYRNPGTTIADQTAPAGAYKLPATGQCYNPGSGENDYVIDDATDGVDGALLIKW